MTIPAKFDLVWFSGIRREYLNVKKFKIYDKRHPSFGKRSHCRGELKKKKKKKQKNADMIILCDHKMDTANNNNNIFTLLIQYKC